ncbi:cap-specific mRNA (nucleoside-2'-O-)-methyltransferase 2-like [Dermatophagoides pteronyssinus]|uniref:cap-specific mRNA (nucleoside-2'-O-)-methyltransferase 2-like n=1 Tax=Dermatophagoides pteronyssinus TaxID=6956 RepID=UPI003F6794A6
MSILEDYSSKYCIKCNCEKQSCQLFHIDNDDHNEFDLVKDEWQIDRLQNIRQQLNECKGQISQYPINDWNEHTDFTEISSGIKDHIHRSKLFRRNIPPLLTRAWIKFYDILCTFNLIDNNNDDDEDSNNIRVLFLCEAPGAFINATNHFIKSRLQDSVNFEWIANTLNPYYEQIDRRNCIWMDWFIREPKCFQNWFFGHSNKGDILEVSYLKSLNDYLKKRFHSNDNDDNNDGTFDLITGDGAFDCFDCFDRQEESVFPLITAEIKISLENLRNGGNMVIKFFTFFNCKTISLLFLLSNCFDNVYCYKPIASKKGNSEIYIIGKGFHRQHYLLKWSDKLKIINQFPIGLQELISDIFNQSMIIDQTLIIDRKLIPNEFIEKICKIVTNLAVKQMQAINYNIRLFKSLTTEIIDEIEQSKQSLANTFIQQFKLFPIDKSKRIVYPSAYSTTTTTPIFSKKLEQFYQSLQQNNRYKIEDKNDIEKLCQILLKSLSVDDQPIKWNSSIIDENIVLLSIKPIYGESYQLINNSRFVCMFLLKSYENIQSFCHRSLFYPPIKYYYNVDTVSKECLISRKRWHIITVKSLINERSLIDTNDYELCQELYRKFFQKNLSKNENLIICIRSLLSRLSVSIIFILTKFFKKYQFISSCDGIYLLFNDFNLNDENYNLYQQFSSSIYWQSTLLELISIPIIQSDQIFFNAIMIANNYNLLFQLKRVSNIFLDIHNEKNDCLNITSTSSSSTA